MATGDNSDLMPLRYSIRSGVVLMVNPFTPNALSCNIHTPKDVIEEKDGNLQEILSLVRSHPAWNAGETLLCKGS